MLTATLLTAAITALTILIHYEALRLVHWWHDYRWGGLRTKVVLGVFLLFAAHSIEIWLFAGGIYLAKNHLLLGDLEGAFDGSWRDYLYISVVTYASVGYGDIRPTGFVRTICGFEALTGIMMMAWSASYTVFRLQNFWMVYRDDDEV
ncbi:MAG: potassium channel family protein [Alphaproteobacteria bacterium]|nr:potassium channel family protein [Alphaproteobacteria bacterium]